MNSVERFALLVGYSVNRVERDYGYDLLISTHDANGEIENGFILLQLKASDRPLYLKTEGAISFPVETSDLELWTTEIYPVILVMYDAKSENAYWLYIQRELENKSLEEMGNSYTVRLPLTQVLNTDAFLLFSEFKNKIYEYLKKELSHA